MREIIIFLQDFRFGSSVSEQAQDVFNRQTCAFDDGFAEHDLGIEMYACKKLLVFHEYGRQRKEGGERTIIYRSNDSVLRIAQALFPAAV